MSRWALTAILATLATAAAAADPEPSWRTVEQTTSGAYTLAIQQDQPGRGEQGSEVSPRLVISGPGGGLTIELEGGLLTIRDGLGDDRALAAGNRLRSRWLLDSPRLKDRAGRPLLVVFGQAFASDPGSIRIVSLAGGKPQVLLSEEMFQLHAIEDLDHDGVPDLIARRSFSQSWDRCLVTYDPFAVLTLSADGSRYEDATALTKAYNEAHYVWAGGRPREDVAINRCHKPGPEIVPAPLQ